MIYMIKAGLHIATSSRQRIDEKMTYLIGGAVEAKGRGKGTSLRSALHVVLVEGANDQGELHANIIKLI